MGIGRRGLAALWLCVLLVVASVNGEPAIAQSYSFRVPELKLQVTVQPDGSARLAYDITFENEGTPIDIIDIGLPHSDYSIGTMSASINGDELTDIRTSEYIDIGVEIHLDDRAIPTGGTGVLHFEATMPDMVYQDTTNKELASLRITPTWFEGDRSRDRATSASRCTCPKASSPTRSSTSRSPSRRRRSIRTTLSSCGSGPRDG